MSLLSRWIKYFWLYKAFTWELTKFSFQQNIVWSFKKGWKCIWNLNIVTLNSTFPGIYTTLITWNSQKLSSWLLCIPNVIQNKWILLGNLPFPKFYSLFSFLSPMLYQIIIGYMYLKQMSKQTLCWRNKKIIHRSCNFALTENFHIPFPFLQKLCLKIYNKLIQSWKHA